MKQQSAISIFILLIVLFMSFHLFAQNPVGLPVLFVHGFCGDAQDWGPVLGPVRTYLESQYPALYDSSASEYYTYYDVNASQVWFQLPGSLHRTLGFNPASRFFLVALKDPFDFLYEFFDPYQVAQVPIYAKGNELAHIIWTIKAITGAPRVIVIAHSMGGLSARSYIEQLASPLGGSGGRLAYYNDISLLDTIDTPHGGADFATVDASWLWPLFGVCGTQPSTNKTEMIPNGPTIYQLDYATKGAAPLPIGLTVSSIVSYWDFPLLYWGFDNALGESTQDLFTSITNPSGNAYSTLLTYVNGFSDWFQNDLAQRCGGLVPGNPLHGLNCTGSAAQTWNILASTLQLPAVMNRDLQVTPNNNHIHVQSSVQLTTTTLSGRPAIWSILEGASGGTITSNGLYEATSNAGQYHAIAIDSLDLGEYGEATINVSTALGSGFANTLPPTLDTNNIWTLNGAANLAGISGYVNFLLATDPGMSGAVATNIQYLPVNSQTQVFFQPVPGLAPNTKYYYQAVLYDMNGTIRSMGDITSFGTLLRSSGGQPIWPMSGHDRRRSGLSQFAGPQSSSGHPTWTVSTGQPVIGDLAVSSDGNIYFGSDALYALRPDGTQVASPVPLAGIVASPSIDDKGGLVYVAVSSGGGGFDILRYTKQLTNGALVKHVPANYYGGGISALVLGADETLYFVTGRYPGTVHSVGVSNWDNAVCPYEAGRDAQTPNGPALGADGSIYVMCAAIEGGGLYKLDPASGAVLAFTAYNRGATDPMLDPLGRIYSGFQAFGGAFYVGSYDTWDGNLNHLSGNYMDYTTSRASLFSDGFSTVRIGYSFSTDVRLVAEGVHPWEIFSDGQTIPNFTSVPSVDASSTVFIGTTTGVLALRGTDGSVIWSVITNDHVTTQPVISAPGVLLVGSDSGTVYSFTQ